MTATQRLRPTVYLRPGRVPHPRRARGWGVAAALAAAAAVTLLLGGCARHRVLVPPRVDLMERQPVGLVTFTIENARGALNEVATERFIQEIFRAQPGVEVLELGDADRILADVGEEELNARAARAIGEEHGLPAVFVGHIRVGDVQPRGELRGLRLPRLEATVRVDLTVRLLSTSSGATIWSATNRAEERVGHLAISDGQVDFSAENPAEAYGRLVEVLVYDLTRDLRPTWVRG